MRRVTLGDVEILGIGCTAITPGGVRFGGAMALR
jgi:hypothetical protein